MLLAKFTTNNYRIGDNAFRRHLIAKRSKSRPGDHIATTSLFAVYVKKIKK